MCAAKSIGLESKQTQAGTFVSLATRDYAVPSTGPARSYNRQTLMPCEGSESEPTAFRSRAEGTLALEQEALAILRGCSLMRST